MPISHQIIKQKKNKIITIKKDIFFILKTSRLSEPMHNTWLIKNNKKI
jgi:hypothetical protein